MRNKINPLMKQYQINSVGKFTQLTFQTMPLISIITQCLTVAITFKVYEGGIHNVFPWVSLPIFLGLVILCGLFLMWINHVFIYQGFYHHQNQQQFPEDGEVAKLIRKIIREELDKDKNDKDAKAVK